MSTGEILLIYFKERYLREEVRDRSSTTVRVPKSYQVRYIFGRLISNGYVKKKRLVRYWSAKNHARKNDRTPARADPNSAPLDGFTEHAIADQLVLGSLLRSTVHSGWCMQHMPNPFCSPGRLFLGRCVYVRLIHYYLVCLGSAASCFREAVLRLMIYLQYPCVMLGRGMR